MCVSLLWSLSAIAREQICVLLMLSFFIHVLKFRLKMGVNHKKDGRGGKHKKGSFKKKSGPKSKRGGDADSPAKLQKLEQGQLESKNPQAHRFSCPTSWGIHGRGEARIALRVTLQVIDEADLKFDTDAERVQGLHACFVRASELTGSSPATLKSLFNSLFESDGATYAISDTSKRGRGSDEVDKSSLYKVKPEQVAAIRAFIKFSNSSQDRYERSERPRPPQARRWLHQDPALRCRAQL